MQRRRLARCVLAGLLLVWTAGTAAQTRSAMLPIRVVVVRSCSVDTRPGAGRPGLTVTCSRGATPSVVSGTPSETVPAMTARTIVEGPVETLDAPAVTVAPASSDEFVEEPARVAAAPATFELITINF